MFEHRNFFKKDNIKRKKNVITTPKEDKETKHRNFFASDLEYANYCSLNPGSEGCKEFMTQWAMTIKTPEEQSILTNYASQTGDLV